MASADDLADGGFAMLDRAFLGVQNDPGLDYWPRLMTIADALTALGRRGCQPTASQDGLTLPAPGPRVPLKPVVPPQAATPALDPPSPAC